MAKIIAKIQDENANAVVENVVVLPIVFIIIYAIIVTAFVVHDRSALQAAAERGAIYASNCISNPNYDIIERNIGREQGSLDIEQDVSIGNTAFNGLGRNIHPYRYLRAKTPGLEGKTKSEVEGILDRTMIPWRRRSITNEKIKVSQENYFIYQEIDVKIEAGYPIPKYFERVGLDSSFHYVAEARRSVNDPDEFIRNTDLCVDVIRMVDERTGGKITGVVDKVKDKFESLSTKLTEWTKIE